MKRSLLLTIPALALAGLLSTNCTSASGGSGGAGSEGGGPTTSSGGTGGSGGTVAHCGVDGGVTCAADEYCAVGDNECGSRNPGTCAKRPTACDTVHQPTCGCDGQVHDNECDTYLDGVDLNQNGGCTPPAANLFPCGAIFCDLATTYCEFVYEDYGDTPSLAACRAFPAGCGDTPTCACLSEVFCGSIHCEATKEGGLLAECGVVGP